MWILDHGLSGHSQVLRVAWDTFLYLLLNFKIQSKPLKVTVGQTPLHFNLKLATKQDHVLQYFWQCLVASHIAFSVG